mmetsp:Transcript_29367/g.53162  ORF Transcript_29367/g.53162 Transcript_29367/m.53162 type:complete len:106 (-) Transcript_29367:505-822(-)
MGALVIIRDCIESSRNIFQRNQSSSSSSSVIARLLSPAMVHLRRGGGIGSSGGSDGRERAFHRLPAQIKVRIRHPSQQHRVFAICSTQRIARPPLPRNVNRVWRF